MGKINYFEYDGLPAITNGGVPKVLRSDGSYEIVGDYESFHRESTPVSKGYWLKLFNS